MNCLEIERVNKSFGDTQVLKDINAQIEEGEFFTLVGESGCGKSTLLRIISGLETPDTGNIFIKQKNVSNIDPKNRNVAMVFQDYALYPHMRVRQNLEMPLLMSMTSLGQRMPLLNLIDRKIKNTKIEITKIVSEISKKLKIEHLLDRRPGELSGGQRQRVALGRALVRNPDIFLMDEPLSNLDAKLRESVRTEITELHKDTGLTFIYVTHDQTEAMTMSTMVGLMHLGEFLQIGRPNELYKKPKNITVARFIGSPEINIFSIKDFENIKEKLIKVKNFEIKSSQIDSFSLGVRPEDIQIINSQRKTNLSKNKQELIDFNFSVKIKNIEDLGPELFVHCTGLHEKSSFRIRIQKKSLNNNYKQGSQLNIKINLRDATLFNHEGQSLDAKLEK
tara:strand:+ start:216 stop:1391 length:1176 start_codon:yes stop_codon:yes gene_type:complete